jgi:maltose alpha-D-glucosyltransferase/alpha-amylase
VPVQPFRILSKQEVVLEKGFDELFEGNNEDKLESEILPHYLNNNNWFGLKGKDIDYVKLRDMLPIAVPGTPFSRILIVDIYYQEGLPDSYVLPVVYSSEENIRTLVAQVPHAIIVKTVMGNERGILYDGMHDDAFRGALLDVVANRRVVKGTKGELRGTPREPFRGVLDAPLVIETGLLNAGQGNTTVFYNDKAVLKLFRRIEEGINPDIEVGDFLTNARLRTPRPSWGTSATTNAALSRATLPCAVLREE